MKRSNWKRQVWLAVGGVVVTLLAAAVFTLGSLRMPLHPEERPPLSFCLRYRRLLPPRFWSSL